MEKINWKTLRRNKNYITDVQKTVLHYWVWYFEEYKVPPTMERAGKDLGYKGTSGIQRILGLIVKKGYLIHFERRYIPSRKAIEWLGKSIVTHDTYK